MKNALIIVLMLSCVASFAEESTRYENIGKGLEYNCEPLNIMGYNPATDTTFEVIGDISKADNNWLTAEVNLNLTSSDTNDVAVTGTGARTVRIYGLDDDWKEITEDIALAGQTASVTVNKYFRLNKVEVLTAGTGGKNAGDIYLSTGPLSSGVPSTVPATRTFAKIIAGANRTMTSCYSVPSGKSLVITHSYAGSLAAVGDFILKKRPANGIWIPIGITSGAGVNNNAPIPRVVPSKTDICAWGRSSGAVSQLCVFNCYLEK